MTMLIFWLALSIVAGVIASNKGRSGIGFFLLSLVLSPIIGIIAALVASSREDQQKRQTVNTGRSDDYRKCPYCAEPIRREAIKCKHCGEAVEPLVNTPMSDEPPPVDVTRTSSYQTGQTLGKLARSLRGKPADTTASIETVPCPKCHSRQLANQAVCDNCGTILKA